MRAVAARPILQQAQDPHANGVTEGLVAAPLGERRRFHNSNCVISVEAIGGSERSSKAVLSCVRERIWRVNDSCGIVCWQRESVCVSPSVEEAAPKLTSTHVAYEGGHDRRV
jgi:hypothetical protein